MDKQYQLSKKPYLPPRLVAVAFKVELGNVASRLDFQGPFSNQEYSAAGNSGEGFWGGSSTSASGFSNEGYSTFNSSGESGGWVW